MPTQPLPSDPSLEHLKGQAKRLQRAVAAGEPEALALVAEHHPGARGRAFTRADAQLVVARRYGFPSWPRLRAHLETVARYARSPHRQAIGGPVDDPQRLEHEFLRLACLTYGADDPGRRARARALLDEHPGLAGASIHTAAAVGDVAAARALLAADPARANAEGGPHAWPPLLYLAYSRVGDDAPGRSTLAVARLLLESGADPDAGYLWEGLPSPFTALTGAFGRGEGDPPPHAHSLALARLLLESGADPNDAQAVYNLSWTPGDEPIALLLEHGLGTGTGGPWHARLAPAHPTPRELLEDLLVSAAAHGMAGRVRLALAHGAAPDGRGTRHPILEGRGAYELAMLDGDRAVAALVEPAGGPDPVLELCAAAVSGDRAAVERLVAADPALTAAAVARAPALVLHATRRRRPEAIRLLAGLGFDVSARTWLTPLHEAASEGELELVELLLELGADPEVRDRHHDATPLGWAQHLGRDAVAARLQRRGGSLGASSGSTNPVS